MPPARPSTLGAMLVRLINPHDPHLQIVARHESGHAAAAHLLGWDVVEIELNDRGGGSCDFVAPSGLTRSRRLEHHVVILLAARAYAVDVSDGDSTDRATANSLISELASLQVLPADWLKERLKRTALQLAASREFHWIASYLGDALIRRGRLGLLEVDETIREAERDCREGRLRRLEDDGDGSQ
jgi:hypothetical protein